MKIFVFDTKRMSSTLDKAEFVQREAKCCL